MSRFLLCFTALILTACQGYVGGEISTQSGPDSIIGGENLDPHSDVGRSLVRITVKLYFQKKHVGDAGCSGTVISEKFVLTAAHCFVDKNMPKYDEAVTEVSFGTDSNRAKELTVRAKKVKVHPKYGKNYEFDGAVIELRYPLPSFVKPAKMWIDLAQIQPGDMVQVAGWGLTKPEKDSAIAKYAQTGEQMVLYVRNGELYLDGALGPETHLGDSGGPVFINVNGESYLVAVISRGALQDRSISPSVFHLRELIENYVKF